jgi:hypothetical protein
MKAFGWEQAPPVDLGKHGKLSGTFVYRHLDVDVPRV